MQTQVIKRDGTKEPYQEDKIRRVTTAAGLSTDQAKSVVQSVSQWVDKLSNPTITSLQIRDQVVAKLKSVSPNAYNLFTWYEKSKDSPDKPQS